jgi:NADH-quinone oxidoreductase subunit I
MAQVVRQFIAGIYNLLLGMVTTGKHLGRHAITIQYPKERWTMPERSRGMVVLLTDHETGQLNCSVCLLCMRACPSSAITIEYEKDEKGKRHLKEFTVDYHLCCFCGLCEEACNFSAIKLAPKYEFPEFDKAKLIWNKEKLAAMGYDVPYEKPVRKKPAPPKPAPATGTGPEPPKPEAAHIPPPETPGAQGQAEGAA